MALHVAAYVDTQACIASARLRNPLLPQSRSCPHTSPWMRSVKQPAAAVGGMAGGDGDGIPPGGYGGGGRGYIPGSSGGTEGGGGAGGSCGLGGEEGGVGGDGGTTQLLSPPTPPLRMYETAPGE